MQKFAFYANLPVYAHIYAQQLTSQKHKVDLGFLLLGKFYYTSICDLSLVAEARISVVSRSAVTATKPQDQIGSVSNG